MFVAMKYLSRHAMTVFIFLDTFKKVEFFCTNRSSLAKVEVLIAREMSYHDWFMFQEKNGQATTIIRRLVL